MSGLASDSSNHILRSFCFWETPLAVLILSSLCRRYINPFSSGGSALKIDWIEGIALGELMPSLPQFVDLDRLQHVTIFSPLVFADLLTSQIGGGQLFLNANLRPTGDTAQCSDPSQLLWTLASPPGSRLRGIPKALFA